MSFDKPMLTDNELKIIRSIVDLSKADKKEVDDIFHFLDRVDVKMTIHQLFIIER